MSYQEFKYGIDSLSPDLALKIARTEIKALISEQAKAQILKSHAAVQKIAAGEKLVYSINTGFGSLCTTKIATEDRVKLQENLLKSHSVGVGKPIDSEIVKLMLISKVHSLSMGFSGIALEVIERINWHIENNYMPLVPEQGSVGASGDLAPLAHLFLPLIGLGQIKDPKSNEFVAAEQILSAHNLKALELGPKGGLALINGTQFIAAHAIKVHEQLANCIEHADLIGALSLEALQGSAQPFAERLHDLRPFSGAKKVAKLISSYLEGSKILESHHDCTRVQDPYSLRCMPQVHGASRDAFKHFSEQLNIELNSVTDNPVIFNEEDTISGGNFHGQPMALPLDYICLAASELGNISDRRSYLLLDAKTHCKVELPPYLVKEAGLNSGFMIAQYCSAALASENKTQCFPASADSIPTSMGQEDHVSMGSIGARKALRVVENLEKILAIELLCAAQAFDFRQAKSSKTLEALHRKVREIIPHVEDDVVLHEYIEKACLMIKESHLI